MLHCMRNFDAESSAVHPRRADFERFRGMIKRVYLDSAWIYIDESTMMVDGVFPNMYVEAMSICFKNSYN